MKNPTFFHAMTLPALAIACAVAALSAQPALAQTASDLVCDGCVNSGDIKNSSIRSRDILNGQVKAADLANGAVNNAKIANGAVNSAKVVDGSLTAADLAAGSVGTAEVFNNSLTAADLGANSVGASELADNAVSSLNVVNNSLTSADLGGSSVGSSEVVNNSVPATDLSNEPGVEFNNTESLNFSVTSTAAIVRTLVVTAPSSGFVTCIASGAADNDDVAFTGEFHLGWDSVGGTTTPPGANRVAHLAEGSDTRLGITALRTFSIAAGSRSFYLKARCLGCSTGQMDFSYHASACMFFPTQY